MQRDMFEGFDSGSFSKAESLNDLDEITIGGRSAMVISNDDDSKIIAIEYLDSSDSEMQEFTHSEFDTLMNKNSIMFEDGGSTYEIRNEKRQLQYVEEEIKRAAIIIDTHQKNLEVYSDGDEIFTETDVYPDGIVLDNDVEEKIIYIELDDGEMIELPYLEAAKKFYLDAVNKSYQLRDDLFPYLGLSGKEAVLKYKNNSKIKNVTVEEALNTPIKTVKSYRSDTAPKEINALKDKHGEIDNKIVYKFFPKTIEGNLERDFPSIYKEGRRGVRGNRWDNMKFIFKNEKDADEYIEKKGLIYESEPEYRERIKKEQKEINKLFDKLYDRDNPSNLNLKDGGALDKEFKFDKNFVIYVPSTTDVGSRIRPTDLQSRVNLVEKYVAEKFGGFTRTETDGGYKASNGDIIEEDIVKVSVFAKDFDWNQHEDEVVNKVKEWAKLWGQEAIGFEYEGDLYYIDEEGKFMDGGEIEESLPYTATFEEGGEVFNDYFDVDKVKSIENVEVFTNQRKGHKDYVRVDYVPISRPQTMQVEFRKIPFNTDEELNYIQKTLQDNFGSTYAEGGGIGKDFDYEKFNDWWMNKGGFSKTEKIYGKQASLNADKIDPKNEMDNVYSDELEKLGMENNLHLKDSTYAEGGEVEMIEIAEDGSNIPPKLMDIFSEFNEDEDAYKEMEKLRARANEIGYDFSYGLDGTPTEFCEIPKKSWGGGIAIGTAVGGYVGYKIGRARTQKFGFETEKKIGRGVKKTFSRKKKMSKGGSISSHFEGELSFLNY